jgi:hypothetical protein
MTATVDLIGIRYGRLVVLGTAPPITTSHGVPRCVWWCRCDCGQKVAIRHDHLVRPQDPVRSCGCLDGHIPDQTLSVTRCAREMGLAPMTVWMRLWRGATLKDALMTPARPRRKRHEHPSEEEHERWISMSH